MTDTGAEHLSRLFDGVRVQHRAALLPVRGDLRVVGLADVIERGEAGDQVDGRRAEPAAKMLNPGQVVLLPLRVGAGG